MAQSEEGQIEFAILGLVRDPLLELVPQLAENIKSIIALTKRLEDTKTEWQQFQIASINGGPSEPLTAPDPIYGITKWDIDLAHLDDVTLALCDSDDVESIVSQRQRLVTAQASLRLSIREEQQSNQSDQDRADARSCDYGARLQHFVRRVRLKRHALDTAADAAA